MKKVQNPKDRSIFFFFLWLSPTVFFSLVLRILLSLQLFSGKTAILLTILFAAVYALPMILFAFPFARVAAQKGLSVLFGAIAAIQIIWLLGTVASFLLHLY